MRVLLLADIHIGAIKDIDYIYHNTIDIIDRELKLHKTDLLVILGDYFDRALRVDESYTGLAINLMIHIVEICMLTKTKIRIVYGTHSHDMNQYQLFNEYLVSKYVDFKVIKNVEEEIIGNKHILYVPEEYIFNKEEYYKDTLFNKDKHYDYIFGHGNISDILPFDLNIYKRNQNEKHAPLFTINDLKDKCKLCIFGHYHLYKEVDNVIYVGSLYRWKFGEEENKGYGIIENDKFQFIENDKAYIYKTYEFDENSLVYEDKNLLLKKLSRIKSENSKLFDNECIGKIRLIFHPKSDNKEFNDTIRTLLLKENNFALLIKEITNEESEIINKIKKSEYEFILDNSLSPIDKIHMFIEKKYDTNLSVSSIQNYIKQTI